MASFIGKIGAAVVFMAIAGGTARADEALKACLAEPSVECTASLASAHARFIDEPGSRILARMFLAVTFNVAGRPGLGQEEINVVRSDLPEVDRNDEKQVTRTLLAEGFAGAETLNLEQAKKIAKQFGHYYGSHILAYLGTNLASACRFEEGTAVMKKAEEMLAKTEPGTSMTRSLTYIAQGWHQNGDPAKAADAVRRIEAVLPDAPEDYKDYVRVSLAKALVWTGRTHEGLKVQRTLSQPRYRTMATSYLARILAYSGQEAEARRQIDRFLAEIDGVTDPTFANRNRAEIAPAFVVTHGPAKAIDFAYAIDDPMQRVRALTRVARMLADWEPYRGAVNCKRG